MSKVYRTDRTFRSAGPSSSVLFYESCCSWCVGARPQGAAASRRPKTPGATARREAVFVARKAEAAQVTLEIRTQGRRSHRLPRFGLVAQVGGPHRPM